MLALKSGDSKHSRKVLYDIVRNRWIDDLYGILLTKYLSSLRVVKNDIYVVQCSSKRTLISIFELLRGTLHPFDGSPIRVSIIDFMCVLTKRDYCLPNNSSISIYHEMKDFLTDQMNPDIIIFHGSDISKPSLQEFCNCNFDQRIIIIDILALFNPSGIESNNEIVRRFGNLFRIATIMRSK